MGRLLEAYPGYDPFKIEDFFASRGWETELLDSSNVDLIPTDQGAALECGDGRFDHYSQRRKHGPRVFGGINAVAALKLGGDYCSFVRAAKLVRSLGYSPGTHGAKKEGEGCGLFKLWKEGKLSNAYPFNMLIPNSDIYIYEVKDLIKSVMEEHGGKHFTLPGEHQEEALIYNPYINSTVKPAQGLRFIADAWFLKIINVAEQVSMTFNAETVEQLKEDSKKIEILTA